MRAERRPRQFADLIGPFLLRRRKSDPGIAPELPAKTETDHPLRPDPRAGGALRVVRPRHHGPDRAGRPRRPGHPPRPGARAAHRAQADLQPPGALPQAVRRGPADRPLARSSTCVDELLGTVLAEDGAALVFTQYVAMARLLEAHLTKRRRPAPVPARRHAGPRARGDGGAVPGRRGRRSSCSRSRPAAPGSTSPAPTTSSTSTAGGTPPSRSRPPTAPTGSARPGRSRCTG